MSKHGLEDKNIKRKKIEISCIVILLLGILIFSLIRIMYWTKSNKENADLKEKLSSYIEKTTSKESGQQEYKVDFKALKEINPDTIAYLKVNNANIDYAVVKGNDNKYYKNHNFEKNSNALGWVFADSKNKFNFTDYNIVIYGYNTKNDNMFGSLSKTLKEEWYNNDDNKYITFVTEESVIKYEIFSIYHEQPNDYSTKVDFKSDEEYLEFLNTIKAKSFKDFNVELNATSGIITLSTWDSDSSNRIIVHAIRN